MVNLRFVFSYLNCIWRFIVTYFGFVLFGIGGLALSFVWFTLVRIALKDSAQRRLASQKAIQLLFRSFLRSLKILGALDYQFHHLDRLSEDGGCVIVANHPSLLDYVLLASVMPRCDCIVKEALFSNFFVRGVIKTAGYIPNSAIEILLPQCKACLDQNGMLLIFPEGTRTTYGQKVALKRGAANIALRCEADIRVVHIECTELLLTKETKWYHVPFLKPVFTVVVQEKIQIKSFLQGPEFVYSIAARHLTDYMTQNFNRINEDKDIVNESEKYSKR